MPRLHYNLFNCELFFNLLFVCFYDGERRNCYKILIPQHTEFVIIIKTLTIQQIKNIALLTCLHEPVMEINELTYSLFLPDRVTAES